MHILEKIKNLTPYNTTNQLKYILTILNTKIENLSKETPSLFTAPRLASTSIPGYVWTATDSKGNGSFKAVSGGSGGTGSTITVVSNYTALPNPTTVSLEFFYVSEYQGTKWMPGTIGGTYYPKGIYHSNGVTWSYIESPYQATQAEVNSGVNNDKYLTPLTLNSASKWADNLNLAKGYSDLLVTQTMFGLVNVDNTSDANKPISIAQATANSTILTNASADATTKANSAQASAISASAPIAHVSNTSNPHSVTKAQIGLGNVENTTDINKPVSTAQSIANTAIQTLASSDATTKANAAQAASAPISHTHTSSSTTVSGFMSPTDKIKLDGIQAGATVGVGGITNPMTSIGDIIVGGISGIPTKLSLGAEGQVVKIVDGAIIWGSPAAASGSVDWVNVTAKPAFGTASLVDTITLAPVNHSHTSVTTTVDGFMTSSDKVKINAISGTNTGDQILPTLVSLGAQVAGAYASGTGSASGVNTGDETLVTIKSKLGVTTLSGSNTGDQVLPTLVSLGAQAAGSYASGTGSASGTNTGDQLISLSGDVSGSGTSSLVVTLPTVNVSPGEYTNANITVNAKGLVTSVTNGAGGGGGGSLTSVSIAPVNGISATIATPTTTPNISITLGAITPTSVVATGNIWGSNLSGTNTGDNATNSQYSSLISNATHTGDVSGASVLTLPTVNSNVGSFNNITINAKGLATAGSNISYLTPTGNASTLTNFPTFNQNTTGTSSTITGVISESQVTNLVSDLEAKETVLSGNGYLKKAGATPSYVTLIPNSDLANSSVANLGGTNTGDETLASLKTKLGITTLSGVNTGDQILPTLASLGAQASGVYATGTGTASGTNTGDQVLPTLVSLGINNVTNTSDANKPVSTAQATAIGLKVTGTGTSSGTNTGDQTTITGNAGTATSLAGGLSGQIHYQSATGVTSMLPNGTTSQVLQSNGTTLPPSWVTPSAGGASTYYETSNVTPTTSTANATAADITNTFVTAANAGTYRTTFNAQFAATPGLVAAQCSTDLTALVSQINLLTGFVAHGASYGAGEVLLPGRYFIAGATTHTGQLTFDAQGDPTAMWIMKCGAAHAVAAAATSILVNGAKACNIFWLVVGAPTIGAACSLKGTYIGASAIAPGDVFNLEGRIFTQTGAITTSNTTYTVPVGDPTILNLGILKSFCFFTPAGAISNTVVTGGVGDVATGGGAVTGFGIINGTVYMPTDVNTKVSFGIYINDILIPNSIMYTESRLYGGYLSVSTAAQAVVTAGQKISAKVQVNVGSVIVANRTLYATKIA